MAAAFTSFMFEFTYFLFLQQIEDANKRKYEQRKGELAIFF